MRKVYRNAIDSSEVDFLLNKEWGEVGFNGNGALLNNVKELPLFNRLLDMIHKDFEFELKEKSNVVIETKPAGHIWHNDKGAKYTGGRMHMSWCQLGVSLLISNKNDFEGGNTYYADDDKETNKIKSDRKQYDMCVHTSDEWHMVESHTGSRTVMLMFI